MRDPELAAASAFWNEEKPTAAWAGRYGGDFAATTRFFERSRQRSRWIARIQFAAVPLAVTLLLVYTLWRAERRSQAQQAEIAQLEQQKSQLEIQVSQASTTHDQRLETIEQLRRDRASLLGQVAEQKKASAALAEARTISSASATRGWRPTPRSCAPATRSWNEACVPWRNGRRGWASCSPGRARAATAWPDGSPRSSGATRACARPPSGWACRPPSRRRR